MNYTFANLLGAPYRGGNLLLHGAELLSPVGNRVSQVSGRRLTAAALLLPPAHLLSGVHMPTLISGMHKHQHAKHLCTAAGTYRCWRMHGARQGRLLELVLAM